MLWSPLNLPHTSPSPFNLPPHQQTRAGWTIISTPAASGLRPPSASPTGRPIKRRRRRLETRPDDFICKSLEDEEIEVGGRVVGVIGSPSHTHSLSHPPPTPPCFPLFSSSPPSRPALLSLSISPSSKVKSLRLRRRK